MYWFSVFNTVMTVRKAPRLKKRVCKVCGATFQSVKSNAVFCRPNCKSTDQRNRMKAVANGLTIEQARVTILTPELIRVSKDRTCKVCGNTFQGNKNAVFCSDACKQKDFRSKVNTNTAQLREAVTAQAKIIETFYDCQKSYGRVNEIIVECNLIRFSAEQKAVKSGSSKERWGEFTKQGEGRRFNELLTEMNSLLDAIPTERWHEFHRSDIGVNFSKTLK